MSGHPFGFFDVDVGDCRRTVRELAPGSIATVVTSPPYWGLRDYGTGRWEGGDPACAHKRGNARPDHTGGELGGRGEQARAASSASPMGRTCRLCGATRVEDLQIGLEGSLADYVATLVDLFRGVRDALADDGTVWLNLGDTFVSDGGVRLTDGRGSFDTPKRERSLAAGAHPEVRRTQVAKQKDKLLIPHRVALALQDDGWYVRQDCVWSKPNPLPEAVIDRPASSHEYVFLLSKCERYYYDVDAVKERTTGNAHPRGAGRNPKAADPEQRVGRVRANSSFQDAISGEVLERRHLRSVWTIPTQPFAGAHFATFPVELARRCVLAGCRVGGTVLDPFCGSGTVGAAAVPLGRNFRGLELSHDFARMALERIGCAVDDAAAALEEERRARAQLALFDLPPAAPVKEQQEPEALSFDFFDDDEARAGKNESAAAAAAMTERSIRRTAGFNERWRRRHDVDEDT